MADLDNGVFKANIGNYKGLMLCSRPNEEIRLDIERPFISRVDPKVPLGWNPVAHQVLAKPQKRVNYVLARHKQWLNEFKEKVQSKKQSAYEQNAKQKEKVTKLREKSLKKIERRKFNGSSTMYNASDKVSIPETLLDADSVNRILNEPDSPVNQRQNYAYEDSAPQSPEQQQDKEVDDLLKFVGDLDYDQFIEDLEVKSMVAALKKRIEDINKDKDQIDTLAAQSQRRTQSQANLASTIRPRGDNDDARSHRSRASVTSFKQEAEKLKKQQQQNPDWDKSTTQNDKKLTIEDRLVKHIADEILKNNRYLRNIHSNNSLRKILEKEAKLHLQNTNLVQKIQDSQEQKTIA